MFLSLIKKQMNTLIVINMIIIAVYLIIKTRIIYIPIVLSILRFSIKGKNHLKKINSSSHYLIPCFPLFVNLLSLHFLIENILKDQRILESSY